MNAPGSPSSALQQTYLTSPCDAFANDHLRPVGKPAPPLPRKPDANISLMTSSGVIVVKTFSSAA